MSRDTRREEHQKLFRRGNESLHDAAIAAGSELSPVPFMCECADLDCLGLVAITPGEWDDIAVKPNHYVMMAGHQRSEGQEVIGSIHEYDVARKPD